MDLSVVIINWNSGEYLGKLLHSLMPLHERTRVVVVDNGSDDASLRMADEFSWVEFMYLERNMGFAGAANRAIRESRSAFVLLLNPDLKIIPESVVGLYEEIQKHPDAAIVCGPLTDDQGRSQAGFQIRKLPNWWSVLRDVLFLDELFSLLQPGSHAGVDPEAGEIEQPAAALWMMRRAAWEALDGFDESFHPAWFEDVDFCKRLGQKDWRILYEPNFPNYHRGGLSLVSLGRRRFLKIYYGNLLKYLRKHHRLAYPWLWLPVQLGTVIRRFRARG